MAFVIDGSLLIESVLCVRKHSNLQKSQVLILKKKHKYKFLCKFCKCKSVGYASKISVDRHSQHHSSPHHICATCGKQFHEKYNLEAHFNTHDSEKFFDCVYPKCTRRYKCKAEYTQHVKIHTDPQPPFSCPVCNKAFDFKKYLDEHLKIHSDNLPQKCPYCDK